MSTETHEIFKGVFAEISIYSAPAERETLTDPGCPAEFYIEDIEIHGESIMELLTDEYIESLTQDILESNEPDYDAMAEDHYEGLREEARMHDYMTREKE